MICPLREMLSTANTALYTKRFTPFLSSWSRSLQADLCLILYFLYGHVGWICTIYADPVQSLTTAREELHDLDHLSHSTCETFTAGVHQPCFPFKQDTSFTYYYFSLGALSSWPPDPLLRVTCTYTAIGGVSRAQEHLFYDETLKLPPAFPRLNMKEP